MYVLSKEAKKIVYKTVRRIEGIKCDICGEIIPPRKRNDESVYFRAEIGHFDWGNDSVDSIENFDICRDCICEFITNYLKTDKYNTSYINVSKKHCSSVDVVEDEDVAYGY